MPWLDGGSGDPVAWSLVPLERDESAEFLSWRPEIPDGGRLINPKAQRGTSSGVEAGAESPISGTLLGGKESDAGTAGPPLLCFTDANRFPVCVWACLAVAKDY